MRLNKIALASLVLGGSALLAACGDGGGGGSALTLNGTAATGKPVVGGAVSATCKTGGGTATSNSNGSYTLVVNDGVGPCLLSIKAGDTTLYSVTSGSGATQTGNITPLTNMLVNYLRNVPGMTAADPVAWFALPAVKALLADPAALTERVVNDFIPAMKVLLPTLSLSNAGFLSTAFTANPLTSTDDADLEKLLNARIVTETGLPSDDTIKALLAAAIDDIRLVFATGATGAGS